MLSSFFYNNASSTTDIYTLSLHYALPICTIVFYITDQVFIFLADLGAPALIKLTRFFIQQRAGVLHGVLRSFGWQANDLDRKSTRLNSSHGYISYAVFCLKKKKI